jgi:predicted GNAT family N-acyltransferase
MMTDAVRVWRADWATDRPVIERIRRSVFIEEQRVPVDLEWDGLDAGAVHVLGSLNGDIAGTGRLLSDGRIGRLAVLAQARGHGLGSALLALLVDCAAAAGYNRICLYAQTHALVFYQRHGFTASGPAFDDAGIPHRYMQRDLRPNE